MNVVQIKPALNDSVECTTDDGVVYSMPRSRLEEFLKENPILEEAPRQSWWRRIVSWFKK